MSGKKTKQDATEQRLKSLKAQNEAAKIALKQRELDIAEREQEFVEPSEFQRAKILTEMLPSRGGSSLGAQAIRMPMSRPKPIYSPNALRTPIASPQEEIEAKHLDMLDELDQVDQEKIQSLRSKYDYINEMAVRAAKLGFDITGGRGYDPSNEAHRELHEEYVRLRGQAIDEGRRLQELRKTKEKMFETYGGIEWDAGLTSDIGKATTTAELYDVSSRRAPIGTWDFVKTFNDSIESANTTEQLESERKRLEAAQQHADNRIQSAISPEQARYWQEQKTLLQNTYKNLEERKLYLKQQELKDKKAREEAKGDKDAMNVKKIVDPFAKLAKGYGGVEQGDGTILFKDFSGFLDKHNKIEGVILHPDGSVDVQLSGASTEKDDQGKRKGWASLEPRKFESVYSFFNAYMQEPDNEPHIDMVKFWNKFEELGYSSDGDFNFYNIFGDDFGGYEETKKGQIKYDKAFNAASEKSLADIRQTLENLDTWGSDDEYQIGNYIFEKEWEGDNEFTIKTLDGKVVEDKDEKPVANWSIDQVMDEIKNNKLHLTEGKVWIDEDTREIIDNPTDEQKKKAKEVTLDEYSKEYVDKYKGGSKSKATKKEEVKDEVDEEFGDFARP